MERQVYEDPSGILWILWIIGERIYVAVWQIQGLCKKNNKVFHMEGAVSEDEGKESNRLPWKDNSFNTVRITSPLERISTDFYEIMNTSTLEECQARHSFFA